MKDGPTLMSASHPHFLWKDLFRRRDRGASTLIQVLSQNILFQTMTKRELKYLANFVYERVYQPGEEIFGQGERGLGMYLIVRGRVSIKNQSPQSEVLVTLLGESSFFGELALVDPEHLRTATATAVDRCELVGFFKPDLLDILQRKPSMGVKILFQLSHVLGKRLLETTERMTLLTRARNLGKIHEDAV